MHIEFKCFRHISVILLISITLFSNKIYAADIQVQSAWVRETPAGAKTGAVYLTITNLGKMDDELLSVNSNIAAKGKVHSMDMHGGMMRMAEMDKLVIAAGQTVTLEPSKKHIMLTGLKHPLKKGETVPLKLHFDKAGDIVVDATVKPLRDE